MAQIDGTRGTSATYGVQSFQLPVEMSDKIHRLEPNNNPLLLLSKTLDKKVSGQVTFNHMEQARAPRYDQVNNGAGYTSAATSVVVDDGTTFRAGHVIRNIQTGEVMRVTAVSTNTLTVTRSWGSTAAAAITDNDYLLIVGDSHAQGATSPTPKSTSPSQVTNYTEIYKTPWAVTGTAANVDYYAESEQTRLAYEAALEHAEQIERSFFFGEKNIDNTGNQPIYTTGGLYEWITTNVTTQTNLTQQEWHDWMRTVFNYGSKEKWVFCSPLIISALDWWGIGDQWLKPEDNTFGIVVKRWQSSHGIVNIVNHQGLARWGYDGTITGAIAFAVDKEGIGYRYIKNRDTMIQRNIHSPGDDEVKHQYLTECGFWCRNEKMHAILKGTTSYT